jgi:hypothetical protein
LEAPLEEIEKAIYGFWGASRVYFLKSQEDYPAARMIHLSQNYRSPQLILEASSQVIAKNPADKRVALWSEFLDSTKLDIYQAPTDKAEAEYTNFTPTLWIWSTYLEQDQVVKRFVAEAKEQLSLRPLLM